MAHFGRSNECYSSSIPLGNRSPVRLSITPCSKNAFIPASIQVNPCPESAEYFASSSPVPVQPDSVTLTNVVSSFHGLNLHSTCVGPLWPSHWMRIRLLG